MMKYILLRPSISPSLPTYLNDKKQAHYNKSMDKNLEYAARVVARTAMYLLELGMPVPNPNEFEEDKAAKEITDAVIEKLNFGFAERVAAMKKSMRF